MVKSPMPLVMNAAFGALGLDASYQASSVSASELNVVFATLRRQGVRGLNITIPHKRAMTSLLNSLDRISSSVGAVNTVKREGESYVGYNTDVHGILEPLKSRGRSGLRRAFVLGTGGAARAFCEAMHQLGGKELVFLSRNPMAAGGFVSSMKSEFPEIEIEVALAEDPPPGTPELVFNASPAGANGIPLPANLTRVLEGRPTVFDAVYLPVETGLIELAREMGCPTIYGHEMLLFQGLKSLQIWTGLVPPLDVMRTTLLGALGVVAD